VNRKDSYKSTKPSFGCSKKAEPHANASIEVKNTGAGIVTKVATGQEGSYTTFAIIA